MVGNAADSGAGLAPAVVFFVGAPLAFFEAFVAEAAFRGALLARFFASVLVVLPVDFLVVFLAVFLAAVRVVLVDFLVDFVDARFVGGLFVVFFVAIGTPPYRNRGVWQPWSWSAFDHVDEFDAFGMCRHFIRRGNYADFEVSDRLEYLDQ